MAFIQSLSTSTPFHLSHRQSVSSKNLTIFPKIRLRILGNSFPVLAYSAPKSIPATEQDILEAVAESDGKSLPGVRTYENDLARLTLVGAVDFEQALTAAAADGGETAAEHIASGMPAMVVETVFPGPPDERSTVSTRLFLPARKVKEKAKKLKSYLTEDILSNTTSRNILAMTFRQVVMEQLWNFELVLFRPGTERNMKELQNPREQVTASFALSSSDELVISLLGEVVCLAAVESTERHFLRNSLGRTSNNFFHWFHKPERIASTDSSVTIYKLFDDEIIASAKSLLETFNSEKGNYKPLQSNVNYSWWTLPIYSKLEKIGGPEFITWINEYVPAYRLQIDTDRLHNVKFEGWKKSAENRWEVLLTHFQMVGLANILDMYYEDSYTLPSKQLCGTIAKPVNLFTNKRITSLLKLFSITLASGFFLVTISIFGQLCLPYLCTGRKYPSENHSRQSSEIDYMLHRDIESTKLEDFCISIVKKIKDAFGWPGNIMTEKSVGAWIGELPAVLRKLGEADLSLGEIPSSSAPLKENDEELGTSTQDIASYQVVLSTDGKIVGFQPTSRVAVNHWAANPLAKELYGGRKLSPGFIEPGLKKINPRDLVVLELLMSVNPDSSFALARLVE
ncbi:hypothetical protein LOK49_LG09G01984 [Camellia lanceoleosa]|uniref:Uncharacterized protein n=1 Tax=Camellia lanceoleosa TaxID=1840588 RepID=A0ACC0GMH1_9ERIC|nr:hypothetical protein LOK49_LG09G01984 [Camellia lanceoleosa]